MNPSTGTDKYQIINNKIQTNKKPNSKQGDKY